MTEHLSRSQVELYATGAALPADFLAYDDHLTQCESCRNLLAEINGAREKATQWHSQLPGEEPSHLEYEQLESYLDGLSDAIDREIVESHLQLCVMCAGQVRDLQIEKGRLRTFRGRKTSSFNVLAMAAILAIIALGLAIWVRNYKFTPPETKLSHSFVISVKDGNHKIGLTPDGQLQGADDFPKQFQELAKTALRDQKAPHPDWLAKLQRDSETLMGTGDAIPFRLLSPIGQVVESSRPVFSWEPLSDAESYRVNVYRPNFQKVVVSDSVTSTSWTTTEQLPRGETYIWTVTATKEGTDVLSPVPPAPEARFRVLEQSKLEELQNLRQLDSHLLLALAYADAGLTAQSIQELQLLQKQNPDSPLIRQLIQSLQSRP